MTILSKKTLLKDLRIIPRILGFTLFILVSTAALVTELVFTDLTNPVNLLGLTLVFVALFIPLGILIGLRNVLSAVRDYKDVVNGNIQTEVLAVKDSGRLNNHNSSYYDCYIDLEKDFTAVISRKDFRKRSYSKGSKFYTVYFPRDVAKRKKDHTVEPIGVYPIDEYIPDDDIKVTLKY